MKTKWLAAIMLVALFATTGANAQEKVSKGKPDHTKMFDTLDSDKDGKLSKAEVEKSEKGKLKDNFTAIDANKDSFIDKAELKAYRKEKRAEKAATKQK